ncbi:MAG: T9SS type A sorting domain-containing protein [Saprospiraceae bacterium]|nr:T9SS type A sorting domain-containing protein [Saprospiraceae bacterium]
MKITKRLSIFFILCSLLTCFSASASHLRASNWHYTCLGGNTYEVTLKLYKSCSGLSFPTTISNPSMYSSASCGITLPGTLKLDSSFEVSSICPSLYAQTSCNGGLGTIGGGKELGIYKDTITLPSTSCADWLVEYSSCCRDVAPNNIIGNLSNIAGYIIIDNTNAYCNSSPVFANNASYNSCINQPFYYNPQGVDPDGDSLVYSIVNSVNGYGDPIPYVSGYSVANPVSTDPNHDFHLNPATGEITFTSNLSGVRIVTLLVQEYRNGIWIGESTQDIEIYFLNCVNNSPTYEVINLSSSAAWDSDTETIYACPSAATTNDLSFDFLVTDVDLGQTVSLSHNLSHPSATLNITGTNPVTGTFSWNNLPSQDTVLNIDIVIEDNACPIKSRELIPLTIKITAGQVTASASGTNLCPGDTVELTAAWIPDVYTGNIDWSNGAFGDTITVNTVGTFVATGSFCSSTTTSNAVVVNAIASPIVSISDDTTMFAGETANLLVEDNGNSTFSYTWTPSTGLSCTNCPNPLASPTQTTQYIVEVTDMVNGCVEQDSVLVSIDTAYYGVDTIFNLVGAGDTLSMLVNAPQQILSTAQSLQNICGSIDGVFISGAGDSTFTYIAPLFTEDIDTLCVEICSSLGICDTTVYIVTTTDCVWAGDTDTNQVVNNFDVLNLGLGFGETGPARLDAGLDFDCELVENWANSTTLNLTNYKHADTDGNGIVNLDDTTAINLNWGEMYLRHGEEERRSGVPLYIAPTVTTPNTVLELPIMLGDVNNVVTGAYGIAFSFTYDDTYVEPNSVEIIYSNSWMGTSGTDLLGMHKDFYGMTTTQIGITRLDGLTESGYGEIARVRLTIKDDIMMRSGMEERLDLAIVDAYLITNQEEEIETAAESTQILITNDLSNVQQMEEGTLTLEVHPNPSKGQFNLSLNEASAVERIQVIDLAGRIVYQTEIDKNLLNSVYFVDCSHLTNGVYFIQLKTSKGLYSEKLIIQD